MSGDVINTRAVRAYATAQVWDPIDRIQKSVRFSVEIDIQALADSMAAKAVTNRSQRATKCEGAIVVKVLS